MKGRILVVDDEAVILKALGKFLLAEGYDVETANDGGEAIEKIKYKHFDLIFTDLKMPNMTGLELIRKVKKINSEVMFIVMTGYASIATAISAIKEGAFHYVTKPFDLADVGMIIAKAIDHKRMENENRILKKQVITGYGFDKIIGHSDAIQKVLDLVKQISDTDSTVLILGESGTGKELIAKALHYNSHRGKKPLVPVNCGAIPENLLESELFGHVRGAFTGAVSNKRGKFETANQGTIFLDEIGDMSMSLQVKILRVLQEKKFEPVGSTETIEVDVRVIAATHQNLEELVKKGEFREDLYYRLNVIPVHLPPLRFRSLDVPLLIRFFVDKYSAKNNQPKPEFDEEVIKAFAHYAWPGNIRELENTIERLCILKSGLKVTLDDLPDKFFNSEESLFRNTDIQIPENGLSLKTAVDDFENSLILKALNKTNGNKNKAAQLLKIKRTTLVEKIKKKNLVEVSKFISS